MENLDIRIMIKESKILQKDLAKYLGITPEWFSAILRKPLSEKWRERIILAIYEMKEEA